MRKESWNPRLSLAWKRGMRVQLQTEAAECGLACLAMISSWHGPTVEIADLRRRFSTSARGVTLKHLISIARRLNLSCRPVRLELEELVALRVPCILHWNLNHFVVLTKASSRGINIVDPACGERTLSLETVSRHFTGIAVELEPTSSYSRERKGHGTESRRLRLGLRRLGTSLVQILVLALALETLVLVSPFFLQWVIDGAVLSADRDLMLLLALGFGLVVLAQAAISAARSWAILQVSAQVSLSWNSRLFGHLLRLPLTWFERRQVGDVVSRFGSLATLQRTVTTGFIESIIDGIMAIATLTLMMFYSAALSSIALTSALLYALLRWASFTPLRASTEEQIALMSRANSVFMESVRAIGPIKLFGHEDERLARWMNVTIDAANRGLVAERMAILNRTAQSLLSGTEHVLIVYLGALAVMEGLLSVGMLLAFVAYRATFSSRVGSLIDKWTQLRMLGLHRDRIADIALEPMESDREEEWRDRANDVTLEAVGVSFRYGDAEPWVLKDVNLRINPGECVAITGGSGSGKTTLLKLLMGLLPPTEGDIRLGGIPLSQIGPRNYRKRIASVLQDDHLLMGSIAENIAFFDGHQDRTRVEGCARIAAMHDEIVAMPMAYETLVGDMGSTLSGGQKQRILLARALYKRPALLFLDEATSHLDVRTEGLINESVRTLQFSRILVAHRPHTLASAGRVIVLERGRVKQDLTVSTAFASSFPRPSELG